MASFVGDEARFTDVPRFTGDVAGFVGALGGSGGCVEAAGGPGCGVLAAPVTGGSAGESLHAQTMPVTSETVTLTVMERRQARLGPRRRR